MIIDCHGHYTTAPADLTTFRNAQIAALKDPAQTPSRASLRIGDDQIRDSLEKAQLKLQRERGTDVTIFSPRASTMAHHIGTEATSLEWSQICNDLISRVAGLYPKNFVGVCMLPQSPGAPPAHCARELERCVKELGFVGTLLNPDPYENSGAEAPPLGDRYWYPLYEKLCELDVPAHIHGTASKSERTPYTLHFINEETIAVYGLVNSNVFKDFPTLKIVVSHGGGAIPYQFGRFQSGSMRKPAGERFSDGLKKLYFDTVLYTESALKLLVEVMGPDNLVFGAECPGVGSAVNPDTGHTFDDIVPFIERMATLNDKQKRDILENNARRLYKIPAAEPALAKA